MRAFSRVTKTLCLTGALLVVLASAASASRAIDVEPGGAIRATSREVVFREPFNIINITCEVTLNGEVGRSIVKTRGNEIGRITSGTAARCRGAQGVVILISREQPSVMRYESFEGTLPAITGVTISADRAAFRIDVNEELRCLYSNRERGERVKARIDETARGQRFNQARFREVEVPKAEGPGGCPGSGSLSATFRIEPVQTVRLRN